MTDREKDTVLFLRIARDLKVTKATIGIEMVKTLYDLITRQKAEIETLKEQRANLIRSNTALSNEVLEGINEGIRDFAERLEKESVQAISCNTYDNVVLISDIENLVKEMTREVDR